MLSFNVTAVAPRSVCGCACVKQSFDSLHYVRIAYVYLCISMCILKKEIGFSLDFVSVFVSIAVAVALRIRFLLNASFVVLSIYLGCSFLVLLLVLFLRWKESPGKGAKKVISST